MSKVMLQSFGLILAFSGIGKIISFFGADRILYLPDPILGIQFRYLFLLAAAVELAVSFCCFLSKETAIPLFAVAILAANITSYRLALWLIGWHRPCNCMGSFTQLLHLSAETADLIMKMCLAYLLLGSLTAIVTINMRNSKNNHRWFIPAREPDKQPAKIDEPQ